MRGTILHAPGDIRVEDRPDPVIREPTDAVIRTVATCARGSDLWPYSGIDEVTKPRAVGHEYAGIVEEIGADVTGLRPGQLVVGVPHGFELPVPQMFFRNVGINGGPASVPQYLPELLAKVLDRVITPGKVFDLELPLEQADEAYAAMDERRAVKALLRP